MLFISQIHQSGGGETVNLGGRSVALGIRDPRFGDFG